MITTHDFIEKGWGAAGKKTLIWAVALKFIFSNLLLLGSWLVGQLRNCAALAVVSLELGCPGNNSDGDGVE